MVRIASLAGRSCPASLDRRSPQAIHRRGRRACGAWGWAQTRVAAGTILQEETTSTAPQGKNVNHPGPGLCLGGTVRSDTAQEIGRQEGRTVQRKTKLVAALGLVAGGLAVAMFFRHPSPNAPPAPASSRPPVLRQAMRGSTQQVAPTLQQTATSDAPGRPVRPAQAPAAPTVLEPVDRTLPPALPRTYPGTAGTAADWDGTRVGPPLGLGSVRSVGMPAESLVHTITDGDSLPALAQRYLGSAERWPEIYQANRHLLASPELLPIGLQLTVPLSSPRPAEASSQRSSQPSREPPSEAPSGPSASPQPHGRLVPVDIGANGS